MISHPVPNSLSGRGSLPVRRQIVTGKSDRPVTSFMSTYENKVDRKGRVSVPAAYRSALGNEIYQGVITYPSLTDPAIEGFGRGTLDELNRRRFDQSIEGGDFAQTLIGKSDDGLVETIMALASELPFDGEGRIILPARLAYRLARARNIRFSDYVFKTSRAKPGRMAAFLTRAARKALGEHYNERDWLPPYGPWEQRLCLVPDGDFFKAVR